MIRLLFRIGSAAALLLTISCLPMNPYKYFQEQLQAEVGENIADVPPPSWQVHPKLVSKKPLPDGNIGYHYEFENYRGVCRYVLEVDPKTRKIVGWKYAGEDKDKACFLIP
jgi:hypothetical protein